MYYYYVISIVRSNVDDVEMYVLYIPPKTDSDIGVYLSDTTRPLFTYMLNDEDVVICQRKPPPSVKISIPTMKINSAVGVKSDGTVSDVMVCIWTCFVIDRESWPGNME